MAPTEAKRVRNGTKEQVPEHTTHLAAMEEENNLLRQTVNQLRQELDRYRSPALLVAELLEIVQREGRTLAIIRVPNGNKFLVEVSSEAKNIKVGGSIIVEQKNLTVIDAIEEGTKHQVEQFVIIDKPDVTWAQVGGLARQVREREDAGTGESGGKARPGRQTPLQIGYCGSPPSNSAHTDAPSSGIRNTPVSSLPP